MISTGTSEGDHIRSTSIILLEKPVRQLFANTVEYLFMLNTMVRAHNAAIRTEMKATEQRLRAPSTPVKVAPTRPLKPVKVTDQPAKKAPQKKK